MYIYFARSLRGDRTPGDDAFHKQIIQIIREAGHRPQFDIPVDISRSGRSWDEYIYERDLAWLKKCDLVVVDAFNVSHGVGYEVAYAQHVVKIPVLIFQDKEKHISAMFAECHQFYYRDNQDFLDQLKVNLKFAEEFRSATTDS